jgi:bifunctional UDP-N-acetylglucosamine pyrophosphorylase/glucosamine-1-phosphate N-acetyltransferase
VTSRKTTEEPGASPDDWSLALIVLAAGTGTRMRSSLPKPLHPIAGLPMISHVLKAGSAATPSTTTIVAGADFADIASRLSEAHRVRTVVQDPPLGTGDAVFRALDSLDDPSHLLVLFADHPLLSAETVRRLVDGAKSQPALVTILTCILPDAAGYGRIDRDEFDRPFRIVERKDDADHLRTGPTEINSGMMVIDAAWARDMLPTIEPSEATGEFYLTELVAKAVETNRQQNPWPVATVTGEPDVALGVNDRVQLAEAESILRDRIRRRHMLAGVTIQEPQTVIIDESVEIGQDSLILPYSMLLDGTTIGFDCSIGPNAVISRSRIGNRVVIQSSTISDSIVGDGSDVGPYSHLRRGTEIGPRVHVGNFGEIKNAVIAEGAKVGHFSYIGDAHVGAETNIGAGTVTCNFDGVDKHHTEIGAGAFIGSDSMLVAPIEIGDGARTGAGSVVTKDVPPGATVVGVPARQVKRPSGKGTVEGEDEGR